MQRLYRLVFELHRNGKILTVEPQGLTIHLQRQLPGIVQFNPFSLPHHSVRLVNVLAPEQLFLHGKLLQQPCLVNHA